jgi:hypothetical protein
VVLTCKLQQAYPESILPGIDGAAAPAPPSEPNLGYLPPAALNGMHVILDIGAAPGFHPASYPHEARTTARLVRRAASVEVRGTNPYGVARVRSDLAQALADEDCPVVLQ